MHRDIFIYRFIKTIGEDLYRDILKAQNFSINNKSALLKDQQQCGCYYCLTIFSSTEIKEWTDYDNTAICPYCKIDSVIGESSGFPITKEFLTRMRERYFFLVDVDGNVTEDCYGNKLEEIADYHNIEKALKEL